MSDGDDNAGGGDVEKWLLRRSGSVEWKDNVYIIVGGTTQRRLKNDQGRGGELEIRQGREREVDV